MTPSRSPNMRSPDSAAIKADFDAMEGNQVSLAGRLMSKQGMGKVSFCDLQDKSGRISSTPAGTRWGGGRPLREAGYRRHRGSERAWCSAPSGGDVHPGGGGDPAVRSPLPCRRNFTA